MRHNQAVSITTLAITFAGTTAAHAGVVYSQTLADLDSTDFGWFSNSEPRPTRNYKHADNFRLSDSTQIAGVNWWGMSEGNVSLGLVNFDEFQIEFYSSRPFAGGRIGPNQLTASETFDITQTNTTDTGFRASNGTLKYSHQITLSNAISLDADTDYWISISARSISGTADAWQWLDSDLYDGASSSWSYAQNRWIDLQDTDSAFQLVSVPAPGSALALALGHYFAGRRRQH